MVWGRFMASDTSSSSSPRAGKPEEGQFGEEEGGDTHLQCPPPEALGDAPRGHIARAVGQRLFSPFPGFPTPSRSRRHGPAASGGRAASSVPGRPGTPPGLRGFTAGPGESRRAPPPGRRSDAEARGYRQARRSRRRPLTPPPRELGGASACGSGRPRPREGTRRRRPSYGRAPRRRATAPRRPLATAAPREGAGSGAGAAAAAADTC